MTAPVLPNDEIMRGLTKLAIEWATTYFAEHAERFAETLPDNMSGADALRGFAQAIRNTNHRVFEAGR